MTQVLARGLWALIILLQISCMGDKKSSADQREVEGSVPSEAAIVFKKAEASAKTEQLCKTYPKTLVMQHNPDGIHLEIESIENTPGMLSHCKVKLFYGKKEYEFWEGQISVWAAQNTDPFWQYDPKRNAALYHKINGFGEKAVYIANTCQLLILKDGMVYDIVPPNNGATTSTGKENKEIAIAMAKHYKL